MRFKRHLTRTRIEALVVLGFVAGYIWENYQLPGFYRMPGIPGPTVFPLTLGIAMAVCALWLMLFPGKEAPGEAAPDRSAPAGRQQRSGRWHFYLMWGLLLGYLVWMPHIGFVVGSSLLLTALFMLLGERHWYVAAPLALGFSLTIHFAFANVLQIRLPAGILAGLL